MEIGMDEKKVKEEVRLQDLDTGKLHVVAVRRYEKNSAGFVMMWQSEIDRRCLVRQPSFGPTSGGC